MIGRMVLFLLGLILLLPGVCSLIFIWLQLPDLPKALGTNPGTVAIYVVLWAVGFAIAWGGVSMILKAFR
jgi:hypothetical protein